MPLTQVEVLKQYPWPGNIRELQNVIERQTIVAREGRVSFDELLASSGQAHRSQPTPATADAEPTADQEWQRQIQLNVISVLKRTAGKISGAHGAAQLLGLKPTTLASRLKKWGSIRASTRAIERLLSARPLTRCDSSRDKARMHNNNRPFYSPNSDNPG